MKSASEHRTSRENPYPGLRPYHEEDQEYFFGRQKDALLLANKIIASRLTLFYARSGVGKTSLLQTLAAPHLREMDFVVLHFDRWSDSDPLTALLKALAQSAGIDSSVAADLPEISRRITEASGQSLVLVLDQFEELLSQNPSLLYPVGEAIGSLIRSECDVHVVLSLREEFRAALDSLRRCIPDLNRSTFRLQHLSDQGAREAIVEPAAKCGVDFEAGLVELLLRDLKPDRSDAEADLASTGTHAEVELPFLQLVCQELWTAAHDSGLKTVDATLYQDRLGGKSGILEGFLRRVIRALSWRQKQATAKVVRLLAPPSGLKMSYTVGDLVDQTKLAEASIEFVLKHLQAHRIIRDRESSAGTRYELHHDAFIAVLRPWVHQHELQARLRSFGLKVAAGAAVAVFGLLAFNFLFQLRMDSYHRALMENLSEKEPARQKETIRTVADYFLDQRSDVASLIDLLHAHRDRIPHPFGQPMLAEDSSQSEHRYSPLTVRFNRRTDFNLSLFETEWKEWSARVAQSLGIPILPFVRIENSDKTPVGFLSVTRGPETGSDSASIPQSAAGQKPKEPDVIKLAEIPVPSCEGSILVPSEALQGMSHDYFAEPDRESFKLAFESFGEWRLVPAWTYPLWRNAVSGGERQTEYRPCESVLVMHILQNLRDEPAQIVTREAVSALLARVGADYPDTVREALLAHGIDGLQQLLVALLEDGRSALALVHILRAAASYPGRTPHAISRAIMGSLTLAEAADAIPESAPGRLFRDEPEDLATSNSLRLRYENALPELPGTFIHLPVRVHIGDALEESLVKEGRLRPEVLEGISHLRGEVFRSCGIYAPGVQFLSQYEDLNARSFRVDVLGQAAFGAPSEAIQVDPAQHDVSDAIVAALRKPYLTFCHRWVDPEWTAYYLGQDEMPAPLRDWLLAMYRPTDLKLILQGIVRLEEPIEDGAPAAAPGLHFHPRHLLESLVFWTQLHPPEKLAQIAQSARRLRTVFPAAPIEPAQKEIEEPIQTGIKSLETGQYKAAARLFKNAVQRDQKAAADVFAATFVQSAQRRRREALQNACSIGPPSELDSQEPPSLEWRWLNEGPFLANEMERRQQLCLAWSYLDQNHLGRFKEVLTDLMSADLNLWSADELFFLTYRMLQQHGDSFTPPPYLAQIRTLLGYAFAKLEEGQVRDAFVKISEPASTAWNAKWRWDLYAGIQQTRPNSQALTLEWAWRLAHTSSPKDAGEALRLIAALDDLPPADSGQEEFHRLLKDLMRALAFKTLAVYGPPPARPHNLREGLKIGQQLLNSHALDNLHDFRAETARAVNDLLVGAGKIDEAFDFIEEELKKAKSSEDRPANLANWHTKLQLLFYKGQPEECEKLAGDLEKHFAVEDPDVQFLASLAKIMALSPDAEDAVLAFLQTEHPYSDNLLFILSWALTHRSEAERAQQLLTDRWAEISLREVTWEKRLENGDSTAWREMLVGYLAGELHRDRIFGTLKDQESFAHSEFSNLHWEGLTQVGLLTEAYFYEALLLPGFQGTPEERQARQRELLDEVIQLGVTDFYEYHMAHFLKKTYLADSKNLPVEGERHGLRKDG